MILVDGVIPSEECSNQSGDIRETPDAERSPAGEKPTPVLHTSYASFPSLSRFGHDVLYLASIDVIWPLFADDIWLAVTALDRLSRILY